MSDATEFPRPVGRVPAAPAGPGAADTFFAPGAPVFWGEAPGRLDLLGGIADYSGSLVLQMPIRQTTRVGMAWNRGERVRVCSREMGTVAVPLEHLCDRSGRGRCPGEVRRFLDRRGRDHWVAYVVGALVLLSRHLGAGIRGADVRVESDLPLGKGLASSASLEVAALRAMWRAMAVSEDRSGAARTAGAGPRPGPNRALAGLELAALAQRVENEIVGAPCGIMDQVAVHLGRPGSLLPILCQPCNVELSIPWPEGLRVLAVDSGVRHSVGGTGYVDVRCAAHMGYAIIAREAGARAEQIEQARLDGEEGRQARGRLPFGGYLANLDPRRFDRQFAARLPEVMEGREFLDAGLVSLDQATRPDPDRRYRVRAATTHPIRENGRIRAVVERLRAAITPEGDRCVPGESDRRLLGEALDAAHAGYSMCGLGTAETDRIVAIARTFVTDAVTGEGGVYGARVTGGGGGGTVAVLCSASFDESRLAESLEGTGARLLPL